MRERFAAARRHWRAGRESGYPACCVAHFCLDTLGGWLRAPHRDNPNGTDGVPGVVCGVFHAGTSTLPLHRRLAAIAWWQRPNLRPAAPPHEPHVWAPADAALWGPDHGAPGANLDPELDWV